MNTKTLLLVLPLVASLSHAGTLSPARSLIGTWKTPLPVTFHIKTDAWNFGTLTKVAKNRRLVTWVITRGADESTVNITQTFISKSFRYLHPELGSTGYVPDISPNFYTGKIIGTRLIIKEGSRRVGTFNFTTHLMKGDWRDEWEMLYRQRVYTVNQELQLIKQ